MSCDNVSSKFLESFADFSVEDLKEPVHYNTSRSHATKSNSSMLDFTVVAIQHVSRGNKFQDHESVSTIATYSSSEEDYENYKESNMHQQQEEGSLIGTCTKRHNLGPVVDGSGVIGKQNTVTTLTPPSVRRYRALASTPERRSKMPSSKRGSSPRKRLTMKSQAPRMLFSPSSKLPSDLSVERCRDFVMDDSRTKEIDSKRDGGPTKINEQRIPVAIAASGATTPRRQTTNTNTSNRTKHEKSEASLTPNKICRSPANARKEKMKNLNSDTELNTKRETSSRPTMKEPEERALNKVSGATRSRTRTSTNPTNQEAQKKEEVRPSTNKTNRSFANIPKETNPKHTAHSEQCKGRSLFDEQNRLNRSRKSASFTKKIQKESALIDANGATSNRTRL